MVYCEHAPHALLNSLTECYWSVELSDSSKQIIFLDGCTDIIFNFRNGMSPSPVFVVGIMTTAMAIESDGNQDIFGIRFKPGMMNNVIKNFLDSFTDQAYGIDNYDHSMAQDLNGYFLAFAEDM